MKLRLRIVPSLPLKCVLLLRGHYGLKRKGGLGFLPLVPLTREEKFLITLDLNGKTIYDVGGHVGIFTIFFARTIGKDGHVVTFEPNPENYNRLIENVKLNNFNNVDVRQIGLGGEKGKTALVFHPLRTGTGSAQEDVKAQSLNEKKAKVIQIEIDSLDNQIMTNNLPKPDFVKIDVEGLEMDVLSGMSSTVKNYSPMLLIEIHGVDIKRKVENVHRIVEFLIAHGYSIYHVESEKMITSSNADIAKEGHLCCTK